MNPGLARGVDYERLFDFVSRPRCEEQRARAVALSAKSFPRRFLELPPLPVQHTLRAEFRAERSRDHQAPFQSGSAALSRLPQVWRPQTFPSCRLHVFSASRPVSGLRIADSTRLLAADRGLPRQAAGVALGAPVGGVLPPRWHGAEREKLLSCLARCVALACSVIRMLHNVALRCAAASRSLAAPI